MAEPESQQRGLIEGKPGESLFWRGMLVIPRANELPGLFNRVMGLNDHRLLAIVTALLVENRVDRILSAFMPRYSKLEDADDYSFSTKISVLEALNFIPPLITRAAHCLRVIRNEFAHHLEKTRFSELDEKFLNRLKGIQVAAYGGTDPPGQGENHLSEIFQAVSTFCIVGLNHYTLHVTVLREHISQPSFIESLHEAAKTKSMEWIRKVMPSTLSSEAGNSATDSRSRETSD
jgi:Domain of unknown function (DUF4145)